MSNSSHKLILIYYMNAGRYCLTYDLTAQEIYRIKRFNRSYKLLSIMIKCL